jgi:hypothetical protein
MFEPNVPNSCFSCPRTVQVGGQGELVFSPSHLDASIGELINFQFLKFNHTLTEFSFDHPCIANGGFDSGFNHFNPTNRTEFSRSSCRSQGPNGSTVVN